MTKSGDYGTIRFDSSLPFRPQADQSALSPEYHEPHSPVRGETAMWGAVITQALMDAASGSAKPEAKHDKAEALRWLLSNSEDFITVCHYAGFDPDYVRRMAKVALARNCRWRAAPTPKSPVAKAPPFPSLPPRLPTHFKKSDPFAAILSPAATPAFSAYRRVFA